jgi:SAM-dependent methyltransferase
MCIHIIKKKQDYSPNNPHRIGSRFAYAWEMLPNQIERLIDYGCFDGTFLSSLKIKSQALYGVDRNVEQIELSRLKISGVSFESIIDASTKYPNSYFDAATCLEVMEHVPSEQELIRELARIIKQNGVLVLSIPHRGTLTMLDPGNFKFRFPFLVKFYYYFILHDKEMYQRRFVNAQNGMIGDVSLSNMMEHKHYTLAQITKILHPYFRVEQVITYGFFTPVIDIFKGIICLLFRLEFLRSSFEYFDDLDKRFSYGNASYNIILQCIKI